MSGETRDEISSWTIDSLHSHLTKLFAERDARYGLRFESASEADVERDRRYGAQFNAMTAALAAADLRYDAQREGQEKAVNAALAAAEKAVNAALVAADRAVAKAEIAAEKRFDSVNEFRGQLKDQAATLLTRAEADVRFKAIEDQLARIDKAQSEIYSRVRSTDAKAQGKDEGRTAVTGPIWAVGGAVIAGLIVAAIIALAPKPTSVVPVLPVAPTLSEQRH